jgi:hypothetical protein
MERVDFIQHATTIASTKMTGLTSSSGRFIHAFRNRTSVDVHEPLSMSGVKSHEFLSSPAGTTTILPMAHDLVPSIKATSARRAAAPPSANSANGKTAGSAHYVVAS